MGKHYEKRFLRIGEVAAILGVSASGVRKWTNEGKLTAHRLPTSNQRVYSTEEVKRYQREMHPTSDTQERIAFYTRSSNGNDVVNPRGTSQECSSCGWSGDRDYAAAIVIAGRAKQVKSLPRKNVRVKVGPTPKRPSRVVKSSLRTRCPERKRCRADLPLPVSHHGRKNWVTPGVKDNQRTLYSSNPILTGVLEYNESKIT